MNSLQSHIAQYEQLLHALVFEKPEMTDEKKSQKIEALRSIANDLFEVKGDESFQSQVNEDINNLLSVKPGRKLMKALGKLNRTILIKPDKTHEYDFVGNFINFGPEKHHFYITLGMNNEPCKAQYPGWIAFAHELVHALHDLSNHSETVSKICTQTDILDHMNDLEEQHAIIGFCDRYFAKNYELNKLDVLCENAFLFAAGLPPRIDHRGDSEAISELTIKPEISIHSYCMWLENAVKSIREIPQEIAHDRPSVFQHIRKNPSAVHSIPDELKQSSSFMAAIFKANMSLLREFPDRKNDDQFIQFFRKELDFRQRGQLDSYLREK